MLQYALSVQFPHSAKSTSGRVKAFLSNWKFTSTQDEQLFKKAAPIHITFPSGYVPPGYYVRLITSLASKKGVMVLFHTGIYRDQISMNIGIDNLTITEHNETIELQFSRQGSIEEPFQKSCRRFLILLNECFSEVYQWLPGAKTQLAFSCSKCSHAPHLGVPSRAKFCLFTIEHYTDQHLFCHVGHKDMPNLSQKYWLQYGIQQEPVLFEVLYIIMLPCMCMFEFQDYHLQEKIHLTKPAHPGAVLNLAKQLNVDPLNAVIHQYRRYGGDDEELVRILSDMKLTTW